MWLSRAAAFGTLGKISLWRTRFKDKAPGGPAGAPPGGAGGLAPGGPSRWERA